MRKWKENENVDVLFNDTKEHRLKLTCKWDKNLPGCLYIMLNPSTADISLCDPTVNRCINFAKDKGFGAITIVNLFSYRTSKPAALWEAESSTLPENEKVVKAAIEEAEVVIAAWGGEVEKVQQFMWVVEHAERCGKRLTCFGQNKSKTPKHPLYLRKETPLKGFYV